MSVKEEVSAALNELLLPELAEIKKGLADLNASLSKIAKRIGRPLTDLDYIEDMQAAGASHEQAVAIVKAKHEMYRAAKADLDEIGLKVESDLKAVGFTPKLSQALVACLKDKALEF